MMTNIDNVLEDCLARVERGELSAEECLKLYPDLSAKLSPLLNAASRIVDLKDLSMRPEFRALDRSRLLEHMAAHPRRKIGWGHSLTLRYALGVAAFSVAFVGAGTALAQQALPGDALYGWKRASERVWRSVQQDRVEADLTLADRRIHELDAVSGLTNLEEIGIGEYASLLQELRVDVGVDPDQTEWVNEILVAHKTFLTDFFANSGADLPDPDGLFKAIPVLPEGGNPNDIDDESETDSTLNVPPVVPPPVKKGDEQGGDGGNSNEGLLEKVLDELLGLP
jgi:hypothetical protein